jgi:hypothetical protein
MKPQGPQRAVQRRPARLTAPAWLGLLILLALLQGCGATLLRTPCDKPRISNFGVPSSYIVMLPYRYRGSNDANREAARQFDQTATLQMLQAAVAMPATQITLVEGSPADPRCDIDNVYQRVVDNRSGLFWRRLFHSAVFVWGEIYDRGDGMLVQTHLRTFWNVAADRELAVSIDSPTLVRPLRFGADLPSETVSLPARRYDRAEQQRLTQATAALMQPKAEPRDDARPTELPRRIAAVLLKPPWLELQDRDGGSVWLRTDRRAADGTLPETLLASALAAFINARGSGDAADRQRVLDKLAAFRVALGAQAREPQAAVALALADALEGALGLAPSPPPAPATSATGGVFQMQNSLAVPASAQTTLDNAVRQLPSSGEALNLAAVARLPECCTGPGAAARIAEIQQMFERADALERGNLKIARNLMQWYAYLQTLPDGDLPFDRAQLEQRSEQSRRSLKAWTELAGH